MAGDNCMVLKSLKKDPSLADKAYAAIKSAIMCNELTPGTIFWPRKTSPLSLVSVARRCVPLCSVCSMKKY